MYVDCCGSGMSVSTFWDLGTANSSSHIWSNRSCSLARPVVYAAAYVAYNTGCYCDFAVIHEDILLGL